MKTAGRRKMREHSQERPRANWCKTANNCDLQCWGGAPHVGARYETARKIPNNGLTYVRKIRAQMGL
jgi:hypothetical protein